MNEYYIKSDKTPNSLFYNRFPCPMFNDNDGYIDDYNNIIKNTQKSIIKLNIQYGNKKIEIIKNQIFDYKSKLNSNNRDLDSYFKAMEDLVNFQLEPEIQRSFQKANRLIVKPFNKDILVFRI